jgi:hypothetical protein
MIGQIVNVAMSNPSTSVDRPYPHPGQITSQDQINEGKKLVIYGPHGFREEVSVIRGPFNQGGCRCIRLAFKSDLREETVNLADLSVVRYQNGTWNIDYWLSRYQSF